MAYTEGNKQELLDETPVAIPLGCKAPEPMEVMLNRLISNRFKDLQVSQEQETFEEADDFNCDDDFDPASPWEEVFDKHGNSLGFVDQNRYQPSRLYERRLDDRTQSYNDSKDIDGSDGSYKADSSGSDS